MVVERECVVLGVVEEHKDTAGDRVEEGEDV